MIMFTVLRIGLTLIPLSIIAQRMVLGAHRTRRTFSSLA